MARNLSPLPHRHPSNETLELMARLTRTPFTQPWEAPGTILHLAETLHHAPDGLYNTWQIDKGNGRTREINEPTELLKGVQGQLCNLFGHAWLPPGVCGFAIDNSAQKGLRWGVNRFQERCSRNVQTGNENTRSRLEAVLGWDIRDFFPSTTQDQVEAALRDHFFKRILHEWGNGPRLAKEAVDRLASLCACLCCYKGRLPQGAPTSPPLANLVGASFDWPIIRHLGNRGVYMRYADDIVMLLSEQLDDKDMKAMGGMIGSNGYRIAHEKTLYETTRRKNQRFAGIWGMDLITEDTDNGQDLWFKIPPDTEEMWRREMEAVMGAADLPRSSKEFMQDPRVARVLGGLGYVYHVTRYGRRTPLEGRELLLPRELAKTWARFQRRFENRLPANHVNWFMLQGPTFVERTQERPVTEAEFDQRLSDYGGNGAAAFLADVTVELQRLRDTYNQTDGDGVMCNGDDYPTTEVTETTTALTRALPGLRDTEREEAVNRLVRLYAAFARGMMQAQMPGFGFANQDTLLPADCLRAWNDLLDRVDTTMSAATRQTLSDLFAGTEVDIVIEQRDPPRQDPYREHLHLYGWDTRQPRHGRRRRP